MDKWTELRTAYQVAKLGTVSAAADGLGLHRATVNRHIDALEQALGGRIFLRHARGYTLTDLGEEALRVAQKTEELMEDLAGRVRGKSTELEGEIKITVLPPFLKVLMAPIVQFRTENPACQVTLIASETLERLEHGAAHVALRVGQKPDHPDYVVTACRPITVNLYAQDSYIARKGLPVIVPGAERAGLQGHEFVLPIAPKGRLPFAPWIEEHVTKAQIAMTSSAPMVVSEAILAGVGLGFMGQIELLGRSDIHPLLPPDPSWSVPLWLVTHVDLHRTDKVQAMLRCLKDKRFGL